MFEETDRNCKRELMEVNLYNYKQIIKSVREEITLGEFYQILHTYKPTEFYNTMYSEKTPCWYITEYINANTVMYYANGWADKTPQEITIERLYQSWNIEGMKYTKFYTDGVFNVKVKDKDTTNEKLGLIIWTIFVLSWVALIFNELLNL